MCVVDVLIVDVDDVVGAHIVYVGVVDDDGDFVDVVYVVDVVDVVDCVDVVDAVDVGELWILLVTRSFLV